MYRKDKPEPKCVHGSACEGRLPKFNSRTQSTEGKDYFRKLSLEPCMYTHPSCGTCGPTHTHAHHHTYMNTLTHTHTLAYVFTHTHE